MLGSNAYLQSQGKLKRLKAVSLHPQIVWFCYPKKGVGCRTEKRQGRTASPNDSALRESDARTVLPHEPRLVHEGLCSLPPCPTIMWRADVCTSPLPALERHTQALTKSRGSEKGSRGCRTQLSVYFVVSSCPGAYLCGFDILSLRKLHISLFTSLLSPPPRKLAKVLGKDNKIWDII